MNECYGRCSANRAGGVTNGAEWVDFMIRTLWSIIYNNFPTIWPVCRRSAKIFRQKGFRLQINFFSKSATVSNLIKFLINDGVIKLISKTLPTHQISIISSVEEFIARCLPLQHFIAGEFSRDPVRLKFKVLWLMLIESRIFIASFFAFFSWSRQDGNLIKLFCCRGDSCSLRLQGD